MLTFPPVTARGARLEYFSIVESWSKEEQVFRIQKSPMRQPLLTTAPAIIAVPTPTETLLEICAEGWIAVRK
jgi:hypothetical protein